ncbi:hypothetical protein GCM10010964_04180 [Caldovatus sediminis]|uniref:Uncharacterized protein n=1 Tax=Caldovatus sediminis TaxID=2041189 RepID=A0A8J2Z8U8_9PROT|nr:hypothetical protein GCM10010964_04180 [Caldovatus sediminis]
MPARARAEARFAAPLEDPDHAMPSRHRRRLPRPLLFLASLLPVAAAGCVQDGPYGSYDPYYAERARAWQQEEAARRAGSAARYSDFEAERQARWRERWSAVAPGRRSSGPGSAPAAPNSAAVTGRRAAR